MNIKNTNDSSIINFLEESEKNIFYSAIQKHGVFHNKCTILSTSKKGIILSDSKFIYPLGENLPNYRITKDIQGVLGRTINVQQCLQTNSNNWLIMAKIFAKLNINQSNLDDTRHDNNLAKQDIKMCLVENDFHLRNYSCLKSSFIFEESQEILDSNKIYNSLKTYYLTLYPALLYYKNQAAGMISSNFYSTEGAMINLLFIDKKFRGYGLGKTLLTWYINMLSNKSKNIYLFYSSNNFPAKKLYDKMGFQKIDDWTMALRKSNNS